MREELVGKVSHYYGHLGVATVHLSAELKVGDTIHVKGHTSDFTQKVDSMQIGHKTVERAGGGEDIGIKVIEHSREHDLIYRVSEV